MFSYAILLCFGVFSAHAKSAYEECVHWNGSNEVAIEKKCNNYISEVLLEAVVPGVVLLTVSLFGFILFCCGRFLCNCCGSRKPSHNFCCGTNKGFPGYTKSQINATKACVVIVAITAIASGIFVCLNNTQLYNGVRTSVVIARSGLENARGQMSAFTDLANIPAIGAQAVDDIYRISSEVNHRFDDVSSIIDDVSKYNDEPTVYYDRTNLVKFITLGSVGFMIIAVLFALCNIKGCPTMILAFFLLLCTISVLTYEIPHAVLSVVSNDVCNHYDYSKSVFQQILTSELGCGGHHLLGSLVGLVHSSEEQLVIDIQTKALNNICGVQFPCSTDTQTSMEWVTKTLFTVYANYPESLSPCPYYDCTIEKCARLCPEGDAKTYSMKAVEMYNVYKMPVDRANTAAADVGTCKPLIDAATAFNQPLCNTISSAALNIQLQGLGLALAIMFGIVFVIIGYKRFISFREQQYEALYQSLNGAQLPCIAHQSMFPAQAACQPVVCQPAAYGACSA